MSGSNDAREAWVERVLGVTRRKPGPGPAPQRRIDRRGIWRDAKEAVDDGLNALASELRSYDNPDLERIADLGLFALGKGENVALAKALIEYESAGDDRRPRAGAQLRQAIAGYRAVITGHPAVRQIDNNPFGVTVAMAATLGSALDQIERSIA